MKPPRAMLWLFHAGAAAATRQLLSIVIVTLTFAILSRHGLAGPLLVHTSSDRIAATPILAWFYLLTAFNFAMTRQALIEVTATRIRHVSRSISLIAPRQVIKNLRVVLCLATISQAILTLVPVPAAVMVTSVYLGFGATFAVVWPALMSIGVTYFGANALAAHHALVPGR
ncbi:hypothetical protein EBBID32_23490 [Sphingobium indicum BiD32]|uniref:Uncharacterized protein n=1 Tax=Sphingobium indicum BiD32 TaxID=1301087 RepID=N1MMM5_9SPHN|nr:hypothetical protein [Sphingobium indicum]CCW17999.1 hypothetical protein EBBID32_23490 [Sphingobium indicum BiD32]